VIISGLLEEKSWGELVLGRHWHHAAGIRLLLLLLLLLNLWESGHTDMWSAVGPDE
jgi:hypothetical protein